MVCDAAFCWGRRIDGGERAGVEEDGVRDTGFGDGDRDREGGSRYSWEGTFLGLRAFLKGGLVVGVRGDDSRSRSNRILVLRFVRPFLYI